MSCGSSLGTVNPSGTLGENGSESKKTTLVERSRQVRSSHSKTASVKDQLDMSLNLAVRGILVQARDSFRIVENYRPTF